MTIATQSTRVAIALVATFAVTQARAEGNQDAEIAALKRRLQLLEQKIDQLEKQSNARTVAAPKTASPLPAVAASKTAAPPSTTATYAALPVKSPAAAPETVVLMPNNRPTICTADEQNCVAITSRLHFDGGGYDYHPNTTDTKPQRPADGLTPPPAPLPHVGKI